ncbi:hypothetical protein IFM89_030702 [Coptis chinensis]|uniref:Pentatricopeptide repeat-containing protein n=1 Tax=Coptis chinensis TaxID=261450 RepID=A0A835MG95_9MAGN|nr:hypothetical protein IFM89_030702 [Coptis chinensis]
MLQSNSHPNKFTFTFLFNETRRENAVPTEGMLISVLSSSGYHGVLEVGKWVHDYVKCNGILLTASIGTALLSMYAKCGCIDDAICVFMEMPRRDALSWTAMISALSMHGKGQQALACFDEMLSLGLRPDHVTFVGVLSACSHAGFVEEGRYYFRCMEEVHKIAPGLEHYGCMVDILGRGGHLEEAWDLVRNMPMKPDVFVLKSLLSGCASYGNAYASVGRWADAETVGKMMRIRRVVKAPGCSLVEIDGVVHQFVAGNNEEHPKMEEIKSLLHEMGKNLGLADHTCD